MSRFVRASQLRNLVVEGLPTDSNYCDLRVGDAPTRGDLIAASGRFVAFADAQSGGSGVGAVRVGDVGKRATYSSACCQQGGLYDLKFSPHDPGLLATAAGNGTTALWRLADGDEVVLEAGQNLQSASSSARVQAVAWHPSAKGVVATLQDESALVWDAESGQVSFEQATGAGVMSACWTSCGDSLAVMGEDKGLRLLDVRAGAEVAKVDAAHGASRALGRVVAGGASSHGELDNLLFTTGFGLTREREVAVWDVRRLGESVHRAKCGSGTGVMVPVVVPDTKIVMLMARGETGVRAFEATGSDPFLFSISQTTTSANPALGLAALPVAACDVMSCEVSRLLKLTSSAIECIRVEIPRRLKSSFHEELFPPTADLLGAAISGESWRAGEDAMQQMVPVRELAGRLAGEETDGGVDADDSADKTHESGAQPPKALQAAVKSAAVEEEGGGVEAETPYEASAVDKRMSRIMGYVPKFKYARGEAAKKDLTLYNLRPATPPSLAACSERFAMAWQGGGGPIYVGALADVGKMEAPESAPLLNGHSRPVCSLAFDPFDDLHLVSGGDDCYIVSWQLGAGGDVASATSTQLAGHTSAVRLLNFHPSAGGILASGAGDRTVRLWDLAESREVRVVSELAEVPVALDWSYDGTRLAAMDRGNTLQVLDPRAASESAAACGSVPKSHEGAKACNVTWLGDSPNVLTSGCARMGFREVKVWDVRALGEAVHTVKMGTGATALEPLFLEDNGVVLLTARGENTFHVLEVEGLTRATKPEHCGENNLLPHKCNDFVAPGEPTAAVALLPRRVCDTEKTEFARVLRQTATAIEPVSFSIPRAADLAEYFADDVYADTRAGEQALSGGAWLEGADATPVLESLNRRSSKRLSDRDPALAHASLKRAQASAARYRAQQEAEDKRKAEEQEAFERLQRLAVQHEAYNPNLSTGGRGHADARAEGAAAVEVADADVEDDEWDD